jgi:hypothetical protein
LCVFISRRFSPSVERRKKEREKSESSFSYPRRRQMCEGDGDAVAGVLDAADGRLFGRPPVLAFPRTAASPRRRPTRSSCTLLSSSGRSVFFRTLRCHYGLQLHHLGCNGVLTLYEASFFTWKHFFFSRLGWHRCP